MLTYGYKTKKTVFLTMEAHKLHLEFAVATGSEVFYSQPVKLNATGEVVPLAAADNKDLCIGVSIHNAKAGKLATIAMKGYTTVLCKAVGAVPAGPVSYTAYASVAPAVTDEPLWGTNTVTAIATADIGTAVNLFGWAIEAGADGEFIEVVVKS